MSARPFLFFRPNSLCSELDQPKKGTRSALLSPQPNGPSPGLSWPNSSTQTGEGRPSTAPCSVHGAPARTAETTGDWCYPCRRRPRRRRLLPLSPLLILPHSANTKRNPNPTSDARWRTRLHGGVMSGGATAKQWLGFGKDEIGASGSIRGIPQSRIRDRLQRRSGGGG